MSTSHLQRLVEVMDTLRSPGGCPWDGEQTHESLVKYLLEESYEFVDSLENNDLREANSRHLSRNNLKHFIEKIVECISTKGLVYLIFPSINFQMWMDVFLGHHLFLVERIDVLGKPNQIIRTIAVFSTENSAVQRRELIIRNGNGAYTDEYIQLTKDFHSVNLSGKE